MSRNSAPRGSAPRGPKPLCAYLYPSRQGDAYPAIGMIRVGGVDYLARLDAPVSVKGTAEQRWPLSLTPMEPAGR